MRAFGCAAWTDEALACCAESAPLIELGAGAGQWAHALSTRGADVLPFDDFSDLPLGVRGGPEAAARRVKAGDVDVLAKPEHAERTLLLVYPPDGPMARRALEHYGGERCLYVGEGRGGFNADAAFFDELERRWRVKRVVELSPFAGGHERLYVLQRRRAWLRGG
jgi:hypothetical protein